eukprot:GHUV01032004.1.p1 GENE.GHUV01032004.1~~GHUV01032004.1.p1  ORF type:complete len:417 (+),score=79.95 GHUV01032004.1:157-1407(+)
MVNGFGDLEGAARGSDKPVCQTVVQRAYKFSDIVSFALSVSAMAPDEYTLDSWSYKDPTGNFIPASSDTIARWQRGLQACLSFAVKQGFKQIHILGHWDPVHPVLYRPTTWRNLMDIKPYQKAAGLSYNDVMIQPAITALSAVSSPSVNVLFSISGEMGLSNYLYAASWRDMLTKTRTQLQNKGWKSVKVATALNWQMFCGCVAASSPVPGSFDPLRYNASFAREFTGVKKYAMPYVKNFKALLDANDYFGLSGYGAGYPADAKTLSWRQMEIPLQTLAYELSFFGIDLKQYMQKQVIYVEQGLGAVLQYGMLPAPDLATVARYPFSGNWPVDGYNKQVDPWQRKDFTAYRRAFYTATLDLLDRDKGQQYKVDEVFVWSVGSFDIFAVHPISSSSQGSFADQYIIDLVRMHNGVFR